MLLNDPDKINDLIQTAHFLIFAFPQKLNLPNLRGAINITPNEKSIIPIDAIRNIEELVRTKQSSDLVITVNSAERMTEQAQNCFLKLLEEPGNHIHFVFFTESPGKLLTTVRSRAHIFYTKTDTKISSPPEHDPQTINLAKKYISLSAPQLIFLTKTLSKNREAALEMLSVAIELLYKSYFKTGNPKFLGPLERLVKTHDNISKNGHVHLQLVAGML